MIGDEGLRMQRSRPITIGAGSNASSASVRTATPLGPFGMIRPRLVGPRRAGDVEVRPRQAAGELLQEQRRGDRTGRPAAGVA